MARYKYFFIVSHFYIACPEVLVYKVKVERISELAANYYCYHFYSYLFIL